MTIFGHVFAQQKKAHVIFFPFGSWFSTRGFTRFTSTLYVGQLDLDVTRRWLEVKYIYRENISVFTDFIGTTGSTIHAFPTLKVATLPGQQFWRFTETTVSDETRIIFGWY